MRTTKIETLAARLARCSLAIFRGVGDAGRIVLFVVLVGIGLVLVGALVLVDLADVVVNRRRA